MIRRPHTPADEPLDPQVAAELEELERALAGAPNADPVLSALVRDVRADVPPFDGPARSALDARVAAGFRPGGAPGADTGRGGRGRLARLLPTGSLLRPALAIAATALLALVVTTAALTGGEDDPIPASLSGGGVAAVQESEAASTEPQAAQDAVGRQSAPKAAATGTATEDLSTVASPSGASVPSPPTTSDPGRLGGVRRVERSAELTLSTAPDEVQDVADDVIRTVQGLGGVVASSRISTSDGGGEAFFDLRLPTARLDRALADLSKLAHVSALSQGSDDITGAFVSTADRLKDARDERAALLKALGRATTDRQVASLRARIADSRRRIAAIEGELRGLRARTDRATVALTIRGDGESKADDGAGGGTWTPGDAARDALRVLEVAAGVAVIAAAVLLPIGLLALLGAAVTRTARRRGRERALDAAV